MTKLKSLLVGLGTIVLISDPVSFAVAQSALSIGENDSVFIDSSSFKVVSGRGKGEASALIRQLGAQPLGPGAIVFRSGNKLYIADAGPLAGARFGSDRYGSDRDDSVSETQAERDWREWQATVGRNQPRGNYGSDRYGSDRDDSVSEAQAERDWRESRFGIRQNQARGSYGNARSGPDHSDPYRYYASRNIPPRAPSYAYRPTPARPLGEETYIGIQDQFYRDSMGSDRYGADRYGSDRDDSVSEAQAERDWRESQGRLGRNQARGSYGNIPQRAPSYAYRPTPARPASEESYFRFQDRFYGRDSMGTGRYGGSRNDYGTDRFADSRVVIDDPDYAQYRLKKIFSENWTVSDSK